MNQLFSRVVKLLLGHIRIRWLGCCFRLHHFPQAKSKQETKCRHDRPFGETPFENESKY